MMQDSQGINNKLDKQSNSQSKFEIDYNENSSINNLSSSNNDNKIGHHTENSKINDNKNYKDDD